MQLTNTSIKTISETDLVSRSSEELEELLKNLGHKPFRGRQIFDWLHGRLVNSFEEMSDLPVDLRQLLSEKFVISRLTPSEVQTDETGTSKYLFARPSGGMHIESVLIRTPKRTTACVSSQVGCGQACQFCVTGQLPLRSNLAPWEIEGQILAMQRHAGQRIDHVVFMGMGEPFDNYPSVSRALHLLKHPRGLGLAAWRITVSTAGVAPKIAQLGQDHPHVGLAISLAAPDNHLRDTLMPINKRYPIEELLKAARTFPLAPREKITFEYPLLQGVNDSVYHAKKLASLLRGMRAKVNLIPFNESPLLPFKRPSKEVIEDFQQALMQKNIIATIRYSAGREVSAACGQLVYKNLDLVEIS